jgi:hypothetical protein
VFAEQAGVQNRWRVTLIGLAFLIPAKAAEAEGAAERTRTTDVSWLRKVIRPWATDRRLSGAFPRASNSFACMTAIKLVHQRRTWLSYFRRRGIGRLQSVQRSFDAVIFRRTNSCFK